jgi:hypothetical protein
MVALFVVPVTVLLLAGIGCVLWTLVPTFRTFAGPDFEPSPKDEESVLIAQQSASHSGGAGTSA